MSFLQRLYGNHILASLCLLLVLLMGYTSYRQFSIEENPSINFNWILITTPYPGAAPIDIEKSITIPTEDAVRKISDIRFVISNSRDGLSTVLLRFESIDDDTFTERMSDLRRELQSIKRDLPREAEDQEILEITSSNGTPTAEVLIKGQADGTYLRHYAKIAKEDLERLSGVDDIRSIGLRDKQLQVAFRPEALVAYGLNPMDVVNTIEANMQDLAAGSVGVQGRRWTVRWEGALPDPNYVAHLPIITAQGQIPLSTVANVQWGLEKASAQTYSDGKPGVLLSVLKKDDSNVLQLISDTEAYIENFNNNFAALGVEAVLVSDMRQTTENAIAIMESNAIVGLLLVLMTSWIFLGARMSVLISIGIPFSIAGAFWVLSLLGFTLNISVLLGVVIALGMLVDDAVVVLEAIYYHLRRTAEPFTALMLSLKETTGPVTSSVLTTLCAFLPLILLPGILGKFMQVVPIVVALSLLISLFEAFWLLPSHVYAYWERAGGGFAQQESAWRHRLNSKIRHFYLYYLIKIIRAPRKAITTFGVIVLFLIGSVFLGAIRVDFFANDPMHFFYVNIEMPTDSPLDKTLSEAISAEEKVRQLINADQLQGAVAYAGVKVTETDVLQGDHLGQVLVSLYPKKIAPNAIEPLVEKLRHQMQLSMPGAALTFQVMKNGPPARPPITISVRGDQFDTIAQATDAVKALIDDIPGAHDIKDDGTLGQDLLVVHPDLEAIHRAGLTPNWVMQTLRLLVDGSFVGHVNEEGEKLNIRVFNNHHDVYQDIAALLDQNLFLADGQPIALNMLVTVERQKGPSNLRHYDFRRAITVTADLDQNKTNTITANRQIQAAWAKIEATYPGVDLIFSGELDDIDESLSALPMLFLLGIGLIYMVLGTQFKSYFQPLMVLATVPMAFIGVCLGLIISGHPLSLYTLYGVVALSGISVNAAIVLIAAANERLEAGLSAVHAILFAAKRRVIPIIITAATTISGLLSLATGLGGHSQMWGPVATAIVYGLFFSTLLTLFVLPLLYCWVMTPRKWHFPLLKRF